MSSSKKIAQAALASVVAIGLTTAAQQAMASKTVYEKCYGIAAAGKNDCGTIISSCAATVKTASACYAWIYTPKGLCEKIATSSVGQPAVGCKGPNGQPATK